MEPVHDHDCEGCIFVGSDVPWDGEPRCNQVDLYVCLQPSGDHCLIRRYSSEGSQYGCVTLSWNPLPPKYQPVLDRAKARGLL